MKSRIVGLFQDRTDRAASLYVKEADTRWRWRSLSVIEKHQSFVRGDGIYGYRAYTDFNLIKGEFESLRVLS